MVKVTTLDGLELILENEFPCVLTHPSEPKIELTPDPISGEMVTEIETTVEKILYSATKVDLREKAKLHAKAIYDIQESSNYVCDALLEEDVNFYVYNLD